jgi:hypothetical protein
MTGLVLCAFFAMGMMMGLSAAGRAVTLRTANALGSYKDLAAQSLAPAIESASHYSDLITGWAGRVGLSHSEALFSSGDSHRLDEKQPPAAAAATRAGDPIAIVERHDGFYTLDSSGALTGPVSPGAQGDLPVLSGTALDETRGSRIQGGSLTGYAAIVVRAETQLSKLVSEMRIAGDGTAVLFLERDHTAVGIDLDRAPQELERAARVLGQWNGREAEIASLDMTVPDEAIVRLRPARGIQKVAAAR